MRVRSVSISAKELKIIMECSMALNRSVVQSQKEMVRSVSKTPTKRGPLPLSLIRPVETEMLREVKSSSPGPTSHIDQSSEQLRLETDCLVEDMQVQFRVRVHIEDSNFGSKCKANACRSHVVVGVRN